jgi:hypothetical protein
MITTAEQARKLTKTALSVKNDNFKKLVNHVMERITVQAAAGKSELNYPFNATPGTRGVSYHPTEAEKEAVKAEFVKRGFKWTYRESQDPGSPVDCPIDTISW